jgi:hypothetical protein
VLIDDRSGGHCDSLADQIRAVLVSRKLKIFFVGKFASEQHYELQGIYPPGKIKVPNRARGRTKQLECISEKVLEVRVRTDDADYLTYPIFPDLRIVPDGVSKQGVPSAWGGRAKSTAHCLTYWRI